MKITADVRDHAREHGNGDEQEALRAGMDEMSQRLRAEGAEVHRAP